MKDIFDLPINEFNKEVDKILNNITSEELLKELIECGLQVEGGRIDEKSIISNINVINDLFNWMQ